ncbi:MAG: glycosyltransferase family 39 protein [Patescibacteria group bacterium]
MRNKNMLAAAVLIVAVWAGILIFHPPRVTQDTFTYFESMEVLATGEVPDGFTANRIITTYLGMRTVMALETVFGDVKIAWAVMNSIFFFATSFFFYKIIAILFGRHTIAMFGTVLVATNYALLANALDYVMDVGGWAFYLAALYFSLRYMMMDNIRFVVYGAVAVGIGCFFKEYAFLGLIALACAILYQRRQNIGALVREAALVGGISLVPISLFYIWAYDQYGYSYLNWFSYAKEAMPAYYASKPVEYIKVLGSLYTFGWFLFVGGVYLAMRYKTAFLESRALWYVAFVGISALPVFVWPAITQRIFFPIVPFLVMVSCFVFLRYELRLVYFLPLVAAYVAVSYAMDSYVLDAVNVDPLLNFLR